MNNVEIQLKSQIIGGKRFVESGAVHKLALDVIAEEGLDISEARLGFILIYPIISRSIVARCRCVSGTFKFFSNYDYIIEISGDLWENVNEKLKKIILHHELLHIRIIPSNDKRKEKFRLVQHDVQDFREIIKRHGIDWYDELETVTTQRWNLNKNGEKELGSIGL